MREITGNLRLLQTSKFWQNPHPRDSVQLRVASQQEIGRPQCFQSPERLFGNAISLELGSRFSYENYSRLWGCDYKIPNSHE